MDNMSYRNNRPSMPRNESAAAPAPQPMPAATSARVKRQEPPKRSKKLLIIVAVLIVIVVAIAGWFLMNRNSASVAIDSSKYQVIMIKDALNTPTYFGKLTQINDDYLRLTDVYYLRKKSDGSAASATESAQPQSASDFELIKLGGELYGPEDEIVIPKAQVLYFENLKPDGKVSKAIAEAQTKK